MLNKEYQFSAKEYHKKIYGKSFGLPFAALIFIIIILVGVAFLFKPKQKFEYFYFVEINEFLTFADANALANEIQTKNGAGYIYFDGSYHVLANFYLTSEDAETVVDNLKTEYSTAKILKLQQKKFVESKNLTSAQNDCTKALIKQAEESIKSVYNNILQFDKNEINEAQLKTNFISIASSFENVYGDFISAFSANSKFNKAKDYALKINDALNNLKDVTAKENFNSKMKFEMINFAICFYNTLNCF